MYTRKILVLFAHPKLDRSLANAAMIKAIQGLPGITFVDLYAAYPRFEINVEVEQRRLLEHDVVVFQHPLYWYSTPAILKEWQDLVLEYGFAYGSDGHALDKKLFLSAITTGGSADAYTADGYQHYPIRNLLRPIEQTVALCRMQFLPPYVLFAAGHAKEENRLTAHAQGYARLLEALRDDRFNLKEGMKQDTLENPLNTLILKGQ